MFCYNCGKKIKAKNQFCPHCGAEQILEEPDNEIPDIESKDAPDIKKEPHNIFTKNPKVIIIVLIAVIVICLAVTGVFLFLANRAKIIEIPADNITILDCYADWGSAYYDDKYDAYQVDLIMLVSNDDAKDISGIEFTVKNKEGGTLANALNREEPFRADGYIKKSEQGIITGSIWTTEKNEEITAKSIMMKCAYKYKGEEVYVVPEGVISGARGVNNDFYSVKIDNPNSGDIDITATFVAVKTENDKIIDAHATGRIEENIAAGSQGNEIDDVFQDPELKSNYKEYTVFAIDCTKYR
ncbi:MAG: zinc ribbon domain-containing protein [Lentihominibacter sp.]|jgi:hypothetical protein